VGADARGCLAGTAVACRGTLVCDERRGGCSQPCASDDNCQDGLFCNGLELCRPDDARADPLGCIAGPLPCAAGGVCSEAFRDCVTAAGSCDIDHDGVNGAQCNGMDCDDLDPFAYPGNPERCEGLLLNGQSAAHHDEDCNPMTVAAAPIYSVDGDRDHDGFPSRDCTNSRQTFTMPVGFDPRLVEALLFDGGFLVRGLDCDDSATGGDVHPYQPEVCNGRDDNCNGEIDEGVTVPMYVDDDHDGFGTGAASPRCAETPGYSIYAGDCDDANPSMFPGVMRCLKNSSTNVEVCSLDGGYTTQPCMVNRQCVDQPNATGVCE
jgi:hypothetical protein